MSRADAAVGDSGVISEPVPDEALGSGAMTGAGALPESEGSLEPDEAGDSGVKRALEAERKARRAAEKLSRDLQKQLDEATSLSRSELDETRGALSEAQAQLEQERAAALEASERSREARAKAALIAEASAASALRPEAIYRLVKDEAVFDAEGELSNGAALVIAARRLAPELFRVFQGGAGNGGARDVESGDSGSVGVDRIRSAYQSGGILRRR